MLAFVEKSNNFIRKGFSHNPFLRLLLRNFLIKRVRLSLFHVANLFLTPFYLSYFQKQIQKIPEDTQLFFVGRNDFGTQLYLIDYVRLWEKNRGPTCIVILTDDFPRIQQLVSLITPKTKLIYPHSMGALLPIFVFGATLIHFFTFQKIYPSLANDRADALNLFYLYGSGKTEYNTFLDKSVSQYAMHVPNKFLWAYKLVRKQFDYRWDVFSDYFALYNANTHKHQLAPISQNPLEDLKKALGISRLYVVMNINCKDYGYELANRRRVNYPERYNSAIDLLIARGYDVVIQGRGEQPVFAPRPGLIDYAKSPLVSIQNDLLLFSAGAFVISSKSGIEIFASICQIPVLGLNYTEILGMQPAKKLRFYPKYIRHIPTGRILSWKEHIESPCFFEIGVNNYSDLDYEYVDLSAHDILCAVEEFLNLVEGSEEKWFSYTELQKAYKESLNPLHLELFLAQGVPVNVYLQKTDPLCLEPISSL